jgi:D-inositol-3-phosphate glycosyltransferase
MRIAMLSVHTCPLAVLGGKETGGMNVYVRELTRELGRRGYQVDVFTRSQDPEQPHVVEPWPNVRIFHVPAGPEAPYDRRLVFDHLPEFVAGVRAIAAREGLRYDIIHSHYWLSGWVALELQKDWGAPILQMFHTLGHLKNSVAGNLANREAHARTRVETDVMCGVQRIIAATPVDKAQMIEYYGADPERIQVLPLGVDLELFRPIPQEEARRYVGLGDQEERLLLFVGRLDPVKGLNVLFDALCQLLRSLTPGDSRGVSLAVIGGDSVEAAEALRNEAICLDEVKERYGLKEMVAFLGSQSQETLPYYYSAADVCVMPSLYESFGLVALEAMACGTPVVASRVGGLPHVVADGISGYLVPENDPAGLAEKLKLLLTDPDLRARLGAQAHELAQGFSWARVAAAHEEVYHSLLGEV